MGEKKRGIDQGGIIAIIVIVIVVSGRGYLFYMGDQQDDIIEDCLEGLGKDICSKDDMGFKEVYKETEDNYNYKLVCDKNRENVILNFWESEVDGCEKEMNYRCDFWRCG